MPKRRKVDYAEARISTHLRGKRGGHHRLANMCLDCALHACDNPACTTTRPPSRCAPWLPLAASAPERWRRSWHGSKSTLRRPRGLQAHTYIRNQAVTTAGWLCDTAPCIHTHCISGAGRKSYPSEDFCFYASAILYGTWRLQRGSRRWTHRGLDDCRSGQNVAAFV